MPESIESESRLRGSLPVSDSLLLEEEDESALSPLFKKVFMMFFNVIYFALTQKVPKIIQETNSVLYLWSVCNAIHPVKDKQVT